jgi:HEAT repeat protein
MLGDRMRQRLVNLLVAALSSGLVAGALEGTGRLWERFHPPPRVADYLWDWQQRWEGDFYVFASDATGWPPWEEFNADGVRDRTHAVEKPEGTWRVVFLGDSVTLGDGIKPDQAFPQQLQARLDAEGRPVEVFNVALLGWSTRQERIAYQRIVRRYQPDVVVLAVCLNDIPELQNNLTRPRPLLAWLHRHSALVRVLVNASGREIASVEELFTAHDSKKVQDALVRFFAEVRALRGEVQADGARLALVVFPFRFQVRAGAPAPIVQDDVRVFASREAIPHRDLLASLRELGDPAFVDYDHLSPAGARRAAQALAEADFLSLPPSAAEVLEARGVKIDGPAAAIARALRDPDPAVRAAAAWAMGQRGEVDPAPLGALLAHDSSERVRTSAARALGRRRVSAAAPALFAALDDARAGVRGSAARALVEVQPAAEAALPHLVAALGHADPYVRAFATWSLGNLGPAAAPAVPALVRALANEEAFGRGGAAAALAKIGPAAGEAVPALVGALRSSDMDQRRKAARALGRIGPAAEDAVPDLIRAAREDQEYVRAQAVRALARIAPARPEVVAALQAATRDRDPEVRRQAGLAIRGGR